MQFFYSDMDSKKWAKGRRLIEREDYQRLLQFLYEKSGERVILRDIQKVFGQEAVVQRELDMLVDLGIILRKDRTYSFAVPLLNAKEFEQMKEEVASWLAKSEQMAVLKQLEENRRKLDRHFSDYFSAALFSYLLMTAAVSKEERPSFVLANVENDSICLPKDLAFCYQMKTNVYAFESIGEAPSWAKYFHERVREMPMEHPIDQQIFTKIGDVESTFFLDRLGKKIMQIQMHEGYRERRYHLWTDVLLETGDVKEIEGVLQSQLPIYKRTEMIKIQEAAAFCQSVHLYVNMVQKAINDFAEKDLVVFILKTRLLESLVNGESKKGSLKWLVLEQE